MYLRKLIKKLKPKPMRYHVGEFVQTARPIVVPAFTVPADRTVKIIDKDPLFRTYDIQYKNVYVYDCLENDFKPLKPQKRKDI